jgi:ECF transporter S component (folate family)
MSNLFLAVIFDGVQFDKSFDFLYIFKSIVSRWYLYLALAVVIIAVVVFICLKKPPKRNNLSKTQKLAYVSMLSAISVVINMLQISTPMAQLSFVATVCFTAGVLLGPIEGFAVAFIGDLLAAIIAPMGIYSPVIGLATGLFGLVPGIIFAYFKGNYWIKGIISFVITFILSSLLLNTIGLALIYPKAYVLAERFALLPWTLLFHAVNCALSIFLVNLLKRVLPKSKFLLN